MQSKIIIVVNYNKNYYMSETFISLKKTKQSFEKYGIKKIIFWDNLPKNGNDYILKEFNNCEYIPSIENKGLAYIYNYVIKNYCKNYDYLILLDNDSGVDELYFKNLSLKINQNKNEDLFIPVVYVKDKIYSPNKNIFLLNFYFKKIDNEKISSKNIFAINSGMCISTKYLLETFKKYDERLNFYGTDNYFMYNYQKYRDTLVVLPCIINHKLSAFDKNESIEKKIWRFNDIKHSLKILAEKERGHKKIVIYTYILLSSLKKFYKYKDIKFLKLNLWDKYKKNE